MAARWHLFRRKNRRLRGSKEQGSNVHRAGPSLVRRGFLLLPRLAIALVVCALIGGAIYGGRYFLYSSPRFALQNLRISGAHRLSVAAIERRAAVPLSTNLLSIDTHAVETRLLGEPWLQAALVRRELPATLRIEVVEHRAAALVALESLYLCDADGVVFKRAAPSEGLGLPVITGIGRATYVLEPAYARVQIGAALAALARYQKKASRPPIGEVHIDRFIGATLYTQKGLAIELGRGEPAELESRLLRFDAVWRVLQKGQAEGKPVLVFLNNRAHPDHVIVRFAEISQPN